MSDYFSVKPPSSGGGGTNSNGSHSHHNRSSSKLSTNDDLSSFLSSQYLMDGIPAESIGFKDNISTLANLKDSKDIVLPNYDERSPFYVSVPIPNPLISSQNSTLADTITHESDNEAYFVREYPTDILVDRFHKWKKILKGLIIYLREVSYSQEQFARINYQLKSSVKFSFLTDIEEGSNKLIDPLSSSRPTKKQQPLTLAQKKEIELKKQKSGMPMDQQYDQMNSSVESSAVNLEALGGSAEENFNMNVNSFAASGFMNFGTGSIQDIQVILKKHHLSLANQQFKVSKEITTALIPKLEELRKDLNFKIKEIKELHGDFKTNINAHLKLTGQLLNKYVAAVKFMNKNANNNVAANNLEPKHDPYLLKLQLDLQLKRQVAEENYLQEAFINLQTSGMKLEKIIFSKIQHTLQRYSALIDSEARLMIKNLCQELQQGLLSKPPAIEWDHFVSHHPACLLDWKSNDPIPSKRKLSDVTYPNMKSPLAKCIRAGYFSKKSNFSKEFRKGYFVLTPNYMHEFKSSNFFETPQPQFNNHSRTPSTSVATNHEGIATAPQASAAKKGTSLTPILSIPLNDCTLTEATEKEFSLTGKATFIDLQKRKTNSSLNTGTSGALPSHQSPSLQSSAKLVYEAPKILSKKSTISKLLSGSNKQAKKEIKQKKKLEEQMVCQTIEKEKNNIVTWVFKSIQENPTDEEKRHFKKWIQDLKNLTAFNNTNDRIKFIDERMLKVQRSKLQMKHTHTSSSIPTLSEYNNSQSFYEPSLATTNPSSAISSTQKVKVGKPHYIHIQNTPMLDPNMNPSLRSRMNTPAIDDNGNLITMAGKKAFSINSISPTPTTALPTPALSENHSLNSDSVASNASQNLSSVNVQHHEQISQPHNVSITSNGMKEVQPSMSGGTTPGSTGTQTRHQRNMSLPGSLSNYNPVNSPGSINSDTSQGGYFALPINRYSEQRVGTPISQEDVNRMSSAAISRTSSRGTPLNSRHPSIGNMIPKAKLAVQTTEVRNAPPLNKSSSASSLPSVNVTQASPTLADSPMYQRGNGSATNLTATRVHPVRKHKKNVSFSSLNSLMFSKKTTNFNSNNIMNGGIREDDDNENGNDDTIKLNQSLYS